MNRSRFWFYEPQQESKRVCLCCSAELIGKEVGFGVVDDLKGLPARIFLHPCQAQGGAVQLRRQRAGLCGRHGLRLPQIQNSLYCACQDVSEFIA